jgi:uncharacterized protein
MEKPQGLNLFRWIKRLLNRIFPPLSRPSVLALPPVDNIEDDPDLLQLIFKPESTPTLKLDINLETNPNSPNPKLKLEDITVIDFSKIQRLLQNFVSGTPEVQGAAIVSPDGLSLATALPLGFDEERTAAMSASILSLGESIAKELGRGTISRIILEGDQGYSILMGCGDEGLLLVLASQNAKQGVLFLEVKRLVPELIPLLG